MSKLCANGHVFTYNYRLYDKYRRPIASLAVLADERITRRLK
jgi:hypothetical protein